MLIWKASQEVHDLLGQIKEKHHQPRLTEASICVCFADSKPFVNGRFNWGRVSKFSNQAKLFHPKDKRYDFLITICADAWVSVLDTAQREAWLDLHLERCQVEFEPVMIEINGRNRPQKDEWGRIQYTEEIKRDDDGNPKWKVDPLDLTIFQENVRRYGCWSTDLLSFRDSLKNCQI